MTDGILLLDKPANMTSFGVVARVRRILSEQQRSLHEGRGFCTEMDGKKDASSAASRTLVYAERAAQQTDAAVRSEPSGVSGSAGEQAWRCKCRVKVGHTGTLDPFATGLMILVVGKECKNAGSYSKLDKVYEATIHLGQTSTTGDPEGEITTVVSDQLSAISREDVEKVLKTFVGEITQVPPIFSAIKINGQRAYKLAHRGETVEMPPRQVTVYSLELLDYTYPEVRVRAHVSSGTYIRTLAEDIGSALGVGAYCRELRRTAIADRLVTEADDSYDLTT